MRFFKYLNQFEVLIKILLHFDAELYQSSSSNDFLKNSPIVSP